MEIKKTKCFLSTTVRIANEHMALCTMKKMWMWPLNWIGLTRGDRISNLSEYRAGKNEEEENNVKTL